MPFDILQKMSAPARPMAGAFAPLQYIENVGYFAMPRDARPAQSPHPGGG